MPRPQTWTDDLKIRRNCALIICWRLVCQTQSLNANPFSPWVALGSFSTVGVPTKGGPGWFRSSVLRMGGSASSTMVIPENEDIPAVIPGTVPNEVKPRRWR